MLRPRTPIDRGGYLAMPLVDNVPEPRDKAWKRTACPACGRECWDRPLPVWLTEGMLEGKLCTECALRAGERQRG